ncbi:MAG: RES domain-containing protein [Runella slithyformis]|nr:MAG: RES domain-containing protein [Runella slithyformis]TAF28593.1 MAG: RES domain-containing protein [Runella slithyformis]TAF47620.1 MAG: RES domain-containing protein [Runella slithyformis]
MEVFRLTTTKYAHDLSGLGAKLYGGRWNKKGQAVLYTAGSRSLALVEVLVHVANAYLPSDYQLLTIYIPDDSIYELSVKLLPSDWQSPTPPDVLKSFSDDWLLSNHYLALKVPSAVVKGEYNYLLNPLHEDIKRVQVLHQDSFQFDERLFKK